MPVTRGQLEHTLHRWLAIGRSRTPSMHDAAPPSADAAATPSAEAFTAAQPLSVETASEVPVLDEETLDELYAVIGADAGRIVTVFLEDAPQLLAQLEQAALTPDLPALRDAAHSLKSSSANLGAMALSLAAKRVELGARMQSLDRPAVAVAMVVDEFERARQALQARLQRKRRAAEA